MNGWGHAGKAVAHNVEDVRGREERLSLDGNGFVYWNQALRYSGEINNYEKVKAEYWPEVEELVREVW